MDFIIPKISSIVIFSFAPITHKRFIHYLHKSIIISFYSPYLFASIILEENTQFELIKPCIFPTWFNLQILHITIKKKKNHVIEI